MNESEGNGINTCFPINTHGLWVVFLSYPSSALILFKVSSNIYEDGIFAFFFKVHFFSFLFSSYIVFAYTSASHYMIIPFFVWLIFRVPNNALFWSSLTVLSFPTPAVLTVYFNDKYQKCKFIHACHCRPNLQFSEITVCTIVADVIKYTDITDFAQVKMQLV